MGLPTRPSERPRQSTVINRREDWLAAYLTAIVQRDLRDLANIERLTEIPTVLASLASRVSAPLNKTEVSSSVAYREPHSIATSPCSSASLGRS